MIKSPISRMEESEALYLSQLSSISDIPVSLQHFHAQYEQAKNKLSVVASDTAKAHKEHKTRLQRDIRETQKSILVGEEILQSVSKVHDPPSGEVITKLQTVEHGTKVSKYLGWLKFLKEASNFIEKRVKGDGWRKCLPVYDELNCYCTLLEDTACTNLLRVMKSQCQHWYGVLSETALKSLPVLNWSQLDEQVATANENIQLLFKISKPFTHPTSA